MTDNRTVVVIPVLNPDAKLREVAEGIRKLDRDREIWIVDDGSRTDTRPFFEAAAALPGVRLFRHAVNLGKGRALKTAFNEYLLMHPDGVGVVTADSDGQHTPEDILKLADALEKQTDTLFLGVRNWYGGNIPAKSRFGNLLTSWIFRGLVGVKLSDTQAGLRAIPASLMRPLLNVAGERFEFETAMLLLVRQMHFPYKEIPIQTIYFNQNRETHFRPLADSFKIYRLILMQLLLQFGAFLVSALLSSGIDLSLYALLYYRILPNTPVPRLFGSVLIARVCSAVCNYLMNRNWVFRYHRKSVSDLRTFGEYALLCVCVLVFSYLGTRGMLYLYPGTNAVLLKTLVDAVLFLCCFLVQRFWVFTPTEVWKS